EVTVAEVVVARDVNGRGRGGPEVVAEGVLQLGRVVGRLRGTELSDVPVDDGANGGPGIDLAFEDAAEVALADAVAGVVAKRTADDAVDVRVDDLDAPVEGAGVRDGDGPFGALCGGVVAAVGVVRDLGDGRVLAAAGLEEFRREVREGALDEAAATDPGHDRFREGLG